METRPVWLLVAMMLVGIGLFASGMALMFSASFNYESDAARLAISLAAFAGAGLALLSAVLLVVDTRNAVRHS